MKKQINQSSYRYRELCCAVQRVCVVGCVEGVCNTNRDLAVDPTSID